jgi:hypothetical protein
MPDLVREIQFLKTLPGAIDDLLQALRDLYQADDIYAMVKLLNTRAYHTGRRYRVVTFGNGDLSVTWVQS